MIRILMIAPFFDTEEPLGGGQLRALNLAKEISKFSKLDVLANSNFTKKEVTTQKTSFNIIGKKYAKLRIPFILNLLPNNLKQGLLHRWINKTLLTSACSDFLNLYPPFQALIKKNNYNYIILASSAAFSFAKIVKKTSPRAKIIFDAYNLEYKLLTSKQDQKRQKKIESTFYKYGAGFWACSLADLQEIENMNKKKIKGTLVPNGVDTDYKTYVQIKKNPKNILFCGTLDYAPNKEGLLWFLQKVWPKVKNDIRDPHLTIIGQGNSDYLKNLPIDSSIKIIGSVRDVTPYYEENFVSIVPLLNGSGTRLKILEAMSYGNPVVSTSIGTSGIDVKNGKNILIADDPNDFANAVIKLIRNIEIADKLRIDARDLVVSTYDWSIIGKKISTELTDAVN